MAVLHISGTHIIENRIAEYVVLYLFCCYISGIFSDNKGKFSLIIQAVNQAFMRGNIFSVSSGFINPFGKIYGIGAFAVKFPFTETG